MKLAVYISPNASKNQVVDRNESGEYKIKVQSPPVEGAANKCLIKYIAGLYGISKSKVKIIRGDMSRHKLIEIDSDKNVLKEIVEKKL